MKMRNQFFDSNVMGVEYMLNCFYCPKLLSSIIKVIIKTLNLSFVYKYKYIILPP